MSTSSSITRHEELNFRVFIQDIIIEINSNWMSGNIFLKEIKKDWIKFTYQIRENHNQFGNRVLILNLNGLIKRYVGDYRDNIKTLILRLYDTPFQFSFWTL